MYIQSCPRCGSDRVRRGYRRTPWWWAMFGRYNLLCNSCNWEYIGFAIPGTVPEHVRKRSKQSAANEPIDLPTAAMKSISVAENQELSETISLNAFNGQQTIVPRDEISSANQSTKVSDPGLATKTHEDEFTPAASVAVLKETKAQDVDQSARLDNVKATSGEAAKELTIEFQKKDGASSQSIKKKKRVRVKKAK